MTDRDDLTMITDGSRRTMRHTVPWRDVTIISSWSGYPYWAYQFDVAGQRVTAAPRDCVRHEVGHCRTCRTAHQEPVLVWLREEEVGTRATQGIRNRVVPAPGGLADSLAALGELGCDWPRSVPVTDAAEAAWLRGAALAWRDRRFFYRERVVSGALWLAGDVARGHVEDDVRADLTLAVAREDRVVLVLRGPEWVTLGSHAGGLRRPGTGGTPVSAVTPQAYDEVACRVAALTVPAEPLRALL